MDGVGRSMSRNLTLPIVAGFAFAFKEANEAAKVSAQTEAVIKSTGGAANVSAAQVDRLSASLSRKAAVDDEVVQSGANLLLTFTNVQNRVGKGNDIFDQATLSALDMSVALGEDMNTAAMRVGKALNDPISGLTALRKAGVQFTDQQKEQIKAMVAAGDTAGAQKIILGELRREFGGSAEAAATPFDKLKVKLQELFEEVGTKAMPIAIRFGDVIISMADAFLSMPDWAQTFILGGAAVAAATGPMLRFAAALLTVIDKVPTFEGGMGKAGTAVGGLGVAAGILGGSAVLGMWLADTTGQAAEMRIEMDNAAAAIAGLTAAKALDFWSEWTRKMAEAREQIGPAGIPSELRLFTQLAHENAAAAQQIVIGMDAAGLSTEKYQSILDSEIEAQARSQVANEKSRQKVDALAQSINATPSAKSAWLGVDTSQAEQGLSWLRGKLQGVGWSRATASIGAAASGAGAVLGFAEGGWVPGRGSVALPAMVHPGEFVINPRGDNLGDYFAKKGAPAGGSPVYLNITVTDRDLEQTVTDAVVKAGKNGSLAGARLVGVTVG